MPITHSTTPDGSFSPEGKRAWNAEHSLPDASEISVTQSGTGAITQTVQEVLRLIGVTPGQFGAAGDGTTDDATPFQEAWDAVKTNGGVFYLEKGKTYNIGSTRTLDGSGGVLVTGPGTIKGASNIRPIDITGTNITFRGVKLLGVQGGSSVRQNLMYINGATDVRVESCIFDDSSSSAIIIGSNCTRIRIVGNTMTDQYENGVDIVGSNNDDILIEGNNITTSGVHPDAAVSKPYGITIEPQASPAHTEGEIKDLVIRNNFISFEGISAPNINSTFGIQCSKAASPATNFVLKRCIISGNIIRGCGTGIRMLDTRYGTNDGGMSLAITDTNIIERARNDGIYVRGGEDNTHSDVVVIRGNIVKGYSEATADGFDGIRLDQYLVAPIVQGNHVARRFAETGAANGRNAISLLSANIVDAVVTDNYVANAATAEISDSGTTSLIRNNKGYVTENWGSTSVADGGTISHGLVGTPAVVTVSATTSGEFVSVTAKGATTFTVAIKKHDNSAGTTANVEWHARMTA